MTKLSIDELTAIARETIQDHINIILESSTPAEIGENIRVLAYDSVIGNGGEESQASIIANYMRTQF